MVLSFPRRSAAMLSTSVQRSSIWIRLTWLLSRKWIWWITRFVILCWRFMTCCPCVWSKQGLVLWHLPWLSPGLVCSLSSAAVVIESYSAFVIVNGSWGSSITLRIMPGAEVLDLVIVCHDYPPVIVHSLGWSQLTRLFHPRKGTARVSRLTKHSLRYNLYLGVSNRPTEVSIGLLTESNLIVLNL